VACVAMYHLSSRHPISKDLVESLLGEAGGSAKFSEFSRASLSVRLTRSTRDSVRLLRGEDEKSGKDKKSAGKSRAGRRRRRGAYAPARGAARATRASVRDTPLPTRHTQRDVSVLRRRHTSHQNSQFESAIGGVRTDLYEKKQNQLWGKT
jgi:hypothetical protein